VHLGQLGGGLWELLHEMKRAVDEARANGLGPLAAEGARVGAPLDGPPRLYALS
jgi:hypothetical protein